MKDSLKLIIGIVAAVVVLWLLSSITGFLIWGAVAAAILAAAYFGLRKVFKATKSSSPSKEPKGKLKSKEESDIERLIKEMEEMTGKS